MKSEGRTGGLQCRKCGGRASGDERAVHPSKRRLVKGVYTTSPRAHRHLTKLLIRYGMELSSQNHPLIQGWFSSTTSPELLQTH